MNDSTPWPLTLYFDGDCPLCAHEIQLLKRHADTARLRLLDISSPEFDPSALGFKLAHLQNLLHARFADGRWVKGLDATLWSWPAAGLGRWAALLTWKPLRPLFQLGYRLFRLFRPHLAWLAHPDGAKRCKVTPNNSPD